MKDYVFILQCFIKKLRYHYLGKNNYKNLIFVIAQPV